MEEGNKKLDMKFSEDLFFTNETGRHLYHAYAENLPIIDYHCHLQPKAIYENKVFEDLGEMWLSGDHYKWRAMRTFGIDEKYITGTGTSYHEKFLKFAEIVPYLAGNPLYIWCALELKRFFGIDEPLCRENAEAIYEETKRLIEEKKMTPIWCMEHCRVELVSTTEDPADTLEYHKKLAQEKKTKIKVISATRPDQALYLEKPGFVSYLPKLERAADMKIETFADLIGALEKRLQYFADMGTRISDSGIEELVWEDFTEEEIEAIFRKAKQGQPVSEKERNQYRSAFLMQMGRLYHQYDFVMQMHIGTYQGANRYGERTIGAACGFDCIDDSTMVKSIGTLLNRLTEEHCLPKVILYPLDSSKAEVWAALAAGFCEGPVAGKVQLGAPWWFHDHAYGIRRQFESSGNLYAVSLSAGMLTDSRSFLSYPRFEVYRRVFCDYLGGLVERHEYFSGEAYLKDIIEKVCWKNARKFLGCCD